MGLAEGLVVVAYGDGFPFVGGASLAYEPQEQHGGVTQLVTRGVGMPGDGCSDLLSRVGELRRATPR